MNCNRIAFSTRQVRAAGAVVAGLALAALLTTGPVRSRSMFEPIGIVASQDTVVSGDALPLNVELEGPSPIQIYSDPPGAVSYAGNLNTASGTVTVDTDPNTPSGPVTVYVSTDGAQVVSTTINAQQ